MNFYRQEYLRGLPVFTFNYMSVRRGKMRIVFILCIVFNFTTCAFMKIDYYSKPVSSTGETDYLLRGHGWKGPKYGYAVNDVNQIENENLIIAVQLDNFYGSYLFFGIWFIPIIPVFGLVEENDDIMKYNQREYGMLTIGVYAKNNKTFSIDACKIKTNIENNILRVHSFEYSYLDQTHKCGCNNSEKKNNSTIRFKGKFIDILKITLKYQEKLGVKKMIKVNIPEILYGGDIYKNIEFIFKPDSGIIYGTLL